MKTVKLIKYCFSMSVCKGLLQVLEVERVGWGELKRDMCMGSHFCLRAGDTINGAQAREVHLGGLGKVLVNIFFYWVECFRQMKVTQVKIRKRRGHSRKKKKRCKVVFHHSACLGWSTFGFPKISKGNGYTVGEEAGEISKANTFDIFICCTTKLGFGHILETLKHILKARSK